MSSIIDSTKLDKTSIHVSPLNSPGPDRAYWSKASLDERLAAMEYFRVLNYGQAAASARLQRVLAITELGKG